MEIQWRTLTYALPGLPPYIVGCPPKSIVESTRRQMLCWGLLLYLRGIPTPRSNLFFCDRICDRLVRRLLVIITEQERLSSLSRSTGLRVRSSDSQPAVLLLHSSHIYGAAYSPLYVYVIQQWLLCCVCKHSYVLLGYLIVWDIPMDLDKDIGWLIWGYPIITHHCHVRYIGSSIRSLRIKTFNHKGFSYWADIQLTRANHTCIFYY